MTMLAFVGLDHHAYMRSTDPLERMVDVIVGERLGKMRVAQQEGMAKAIGAETGNRVGPIVGRGLSEAMRAIGRAMSRR